MMKGLYFVSFYRIEPHGNLPFSAFERVRTSFVHPLRSIPTCMISFGWWGCEGRGASQLKAARGSRDSS